MNKNIGRNDPCPCGSNKKYKKCCLSDHNVSVRAEYTPKYRFDPGSYGDVGNFMPSIACEKLLQDGSWEYHFILVKRDKIFDKEDEAEEMSGQDISNAFEIKGINGTDAEFALTLKSKGYSKVDNFNIVGSNQYQA